VAKCGTIRRSVTTLFAHLLWVNKERLPVDSSHTMLNCIPFRQSASLRAASMLIDVLPDAPGRPNLIWARARSREVNDRLRLPLSPLDTPHT
jgi:hypothetical protein